MGGCAAIVDPLCGVRSEALQFAAGVGQPISDVPLVSAIGDPSFEAVDLIDERPAPHLGCPVLIWVHGVGRYPAAVTQRDAPRNTGN